MDTGFPATLARYLAIVFLQENVCNLPFVRIVFFSNLPVFDVFYDHGVVDALQVSFNLFRGTVHDSDVWQAAITHIFGQTAVLIHTGNFQKFPE